MTHKVELVDFEPNHLYDVLDEMEVENLSANMPIPQYIEAVRGQNTKTITVDGKAILVGGTLKIWEGRSMAWAFVAPEASDHALKVTRLARKFLKRVPGMVEGSACVEHDTSLRFLQVLGFGNPAYREQYGPDGSDHICFSMVNGVH